MIAFVRAHPWWWALIVLALALLLFLLLFAGWFGGVSGEGGEL